MLRFVGNGDQKKFTENPRHLSMQTSQANTKKNIHKMFLESRQSNEGRGEHLPKHFAGFRLSLSRIVRGLLGTGPPDPTLESASPSPPQAQGSTWHQFNIDSTLIRHRNWVKPGNRCRRIDAEGGEGEAGSRVGSGGPVPNKTPQNSRKSGRIAPKFASKFPVHSWQVE